MPEIESPTIYLITEQALDIDSLLREITLPTTGAACFFTGMVRAITKSDASTNESVSYTEALDYEAYPEMAVAKMRQVGQEMRERWPELEGIAIVQRIGLLQPGTPTVLVACTAGHRNSGVFEAARYGIDRLKEIVPVWKKEISPSGGAWIEGSFIPQESGG